MKHDNVMNTHTKLLNYLQQRDRGFIFLLLLTVNLVYLPFFGNPLFFDDVRFFSGTVIRYTSLAFDFSPRWFSYSSLGWTWAQFSDVPPIHRLFNIVLHSACVLLLFLWLRQITMLVTTGTEPSNTKISSLNWGAWLGALFFACNPVSVYAVGYLVQRSILLAALFTLAMQLAYLRGLVCEQKLHQKLWLTLSVIFYFLAVFSKEHSLMAPAILAATTVLLYPQIHISNRALWATWISYLAIGVFVVLRLKGVLGSIYEFDAPELFEQLEISGASTATLHVLSLLTQAGLFFKYLFLWLLPNPQWMSIDMRESFASSLWAWRSWLGVLGFILYGVLAIKLLMRRGLPGLTGLALLYPWLFFMVEFSVIRVQEPFVLYRSYLWVPGLMLLFPLLLNVLQHRKIAVISLALITLSLVPLSWDRLWVFKDDYRLWNDAAALLLPNKPVLGAARIFYNRGSAELANKRWQEAITDYQRVKSINPKIEQTYNNIGIAYSALGKYREAIKEFNEAIALKPDYSEAYYGKGIALKRLHSDTEALWYIKKSCSLKNQMACFILEFQKVR